MTARPLQRLSLAIRGTVPLILSLALVLLSVVAYGVPDLAVPDANDNAVSVLINQCDFTDCPWDLDGSGNVGAADLLELLFNWGPCRGCAADFDGDDIVGASDLLVMLFNWGPCM